MKKTLPHSAKAYLLFFLTFGQILTSQAQLPIPIHFFTFDNTLANTTNNVSFTPSTPLQGTAGWGFTSNRFNQANNAFECTAVTGRSLSAVISNLPQSNNPRTIAFWFKFSPNAQDLYHMVSYGTNSNSRAYGLNRDQNLLINYGWNNDFSANVFHNTNWNHYVISYDGADAIIYRNGQILTSSLKNFSTTGTTFWIGATPGLALNSFSGAIDDLKIYNVYLTPAEVTTLYNTEGTIISNGAPSNGLLAYYSFNTNFTSHNGNHNMTVGTGTGLTFPGISLAKYGAGLNLGNGTSVIENTSLSAALQDSNFTVACWVNRASTTNNYSSVFEMFSSCFYRNNFSVPNVYEFGSAVLNWQAANPQYYTNFVSKPTQSQWVHIAMVYKKLTTGVSNGTITLYIDGTQLSEVQLGLLGSNNIHQYNNKFTIGGGTNVNGTFSNAKCFKGVIDEFYIYDRVLSLQEISDVMLNANGAVVLPLTLTSFTANLTHKTTQLNWASSQEINTSHFEVEYSNNGKDFEKVATVAASGNSSITQNYTAYHTVAVKAKHYYRLKMIDKDGKYTYSQVVAINASNTQALSVVMQGNQVQNQLKFTIASAKATTVNISVKNTAGQVVLIQSKIAVAAGSNSFNYNVGNFSPGAYFLEIADNTGAREVIKFLK